MPERRCDYHILRTDRLTLACVVLMLFLLGLTSCTWFRGGAVHGKITDDEGVVVAGAQVALRTDSGFVAGALANHRGRFVVQALPGAYVLEVAMLCHGVARVPVRTNRFTSVRANVALQWTGSGSCGNRADFRRQHAARAATP
jgi:hypothetical protein